MMAALGQLIPKSLREMRDDGCVRAYWDVMDQCEGTQIFGEADFFLGGKGFQVYIAHVSWLKWKAFS